MADMEIVMLPATAGVTDDTVIPVYQPGALTPAQKMTGAQFRGFAHDGGAAAMETVGRPLVEAAAASASESAASAKKAGEYALQAEAELEDVRRDIKTLNEGGLILKDDVIERQVREWMDDHPEASTTVQDGSLTEIKFSEALKKKAIKDYVTPQMYGAKADGVTDDASAIQAAADFADANGVNLYFPAGIYAVGSTVTFYDASATEMHVQAKLLAIAEMEYVAKLATTGYLRQKPCLKTITIDGNQMAANGIWVDSISIPASVAILGMEVKNCLNNGFYFRHCEGGVFMALKSSYNGHDGIVIQGCNNAKFYSLASLHNGNDGIVVKQGESGTSGGCYIYAALGEQNARHGIFLDEGLGLVSIYSGWLEGNKDTQLMIGNRAKGFVQGFRIIATTPYSIVINSDYATVRDIELQGTESTFYAPVVNGDSIVENVQSAVLSSVNLNYMGTRIISEKLLANLMVNGDMQSEEKFTSYYVTAEYLNTEVVKPGKTYSLKLTSNDGQYHIRRDVSGLVPGQLYKATVNIYNTNFPDGRVSVDVGGNTNYQAPVSLEKNAWNTIEAYFYATAETMNIRFGSVAAGTAGDAVYIADFLVQPCYPKKISTRSVGNTLLYESVHVESIT